MENGKEQIGTPETADRQAVPQLNTAKLAVRTLFCVLTAGALIFACFLSFFPYSAMRFYTELNLPSRALASAEQYLRRNEAEFEENSPSGDGKFADALVLACNNSLRLMNERIEKSGYGGGKSARFAEKADRYVGSYLKPEWQRGGDLADRSALIDAYSLVKFRYRPENHPLISVYSYENYLRVQQYRARLTLGRQEELFAAHLADTEDWTAAFEPPTEDPASVEAEFLLFAELNEYFRTETDKLGFGALTADRSGRYDKDEIAEKIVYRSEDRPFGYFITPTGEFTPLYLRLDARFDAFKRWLADATDTSSAEKMLPFVYYTGILSRLGQNFYHMSLFLECYDIGSAATLALSDDWKRHLSLTGEIDGEDLNDFYTQALVPYYSSLALGQSSLGYELD